MCRHYLAAEDSQSLRLLVNPVDFLHYQTPSSGDLFSLVATRAAWYPEAMEGLVRVRRSQSCRTARRKLAQKPERGKKLNKAAKDTSDILKENWV